MGKMTLQLYSALTKMYLWIFARPHMQRINHVILNCALRARGYGNHESLSISGELGFLDRLAKTHPTLCLDVGANKGIYSQALLEKTGSTIIAFEPMPKSFESLKKLQTRYPERFTCMNVGVGKTEGELDIYFGPEDSVLATLSPEVNQIESIGRQNINTQKVDVVSIDHYLSSHPEHQDAEIDLIKIDTEGFEHEVLAGAQKTIEAGKVRIVQLEYNQHQLFRGQSMLTLSKMLKNYRLYQLLPYGKQLFEVDPREFHANIYCYSNFIFVRSDIVF